MEKDLLKALLLRERTVPDKLILFFTNTLEKMAEDVLAAAVVVEERTWEAARKGFLPFDITLYNI